MGGDLLSLMVLVPPIAHFDYQFGYRKFDGAEGPRTPIERLTDLAVVPREKPHTGAAARGQPRDSPVIKADPAAGSTFMQLCLTQLFNWLLLA